MKRLIIGILGAMLFAGPAGAAQKVLTVSTNFGPNHGLNTIVYPTWKKWIEEATEGRVSLNVKHDLAPLSAQMAVVADGVADVACIFHGATPGRFVLTKLPEFPTFQDFSSEAASAAYWRTHEKYLAAGNEHRGVKLLAVGVHGPGQLHAIGEPARLTQLKGKRVRSGGGVMSDIARTLEVVGVAMPPTSIYESASTGVIEGALGTTEQLRSFRVADVLHTTLTVPGGYYRGSFAIVFNPDTWASLPERDREAIESVSGEKLSRLFGYMMDVVDERGIEYGRSKGQKFVALPDEDVKMLQTKTQHLPQEWAKQVGGKVDAMAALDFFRKELVSAATLPPISTEAIEVLP